MDYIKDYYFFIGMAVMFISIIASKFIAEKGLKVLSNEEKGMIVTNMAKTRMTSIYILLSIIVLYVVVMFSGIGTWMAAHHVDTFILYFIFIVIYTIVIGYVSYKKLKEMNLPQEYLTSQKKSQIIRIIGIICMCIGLFLYLNSVGSLN